MTEELFLHERNRLLLKIWWFAYLLQLITFVLIEQKFDIILPPYGLMIIVGISVLVWKLPKASISMWLVILGIYGYIIYYNLNYPLLVNLLFFYLGMIVASLYLKKYLIIFSSVFSALLMMYFFHKNYMTIFETFKPADLFYLILFSLLLMIYLLFHTANIQKINHSTQESERAARRELYSKNSYHDLLFEHAQDAIIVFDLNQQIIQVNPAFEKIYGWTKEEAIGNQLPIIPSHRIKEAAERTSRILKGESIPSLHTQDQRKDGSLIEVEITLSPIIDEEKKVIAMSAISRDVTFRKETEHRLRQSEKLSLAGEMAAGVTHEIRNPLTVISGFIQMMNEKETNPFQAYTKIMQAELERINLIISEFLVLSKPQAVLFRKALLDELIQDTVLLFETELHLKNIQIEQHWQEKNLSLFCEENQIKQVLLNVFKNAADAMPDGGKIRIHVETFIQQQVPHLSIAISDNGKGIPADILQRIGEPFFTTKEKGTGLGMMITEKIVQGHGGLMTISSELDIGTSVTITLPINEEEPDIP
ncbi:PAS domain S-box protein [Jeotgalibacillus sp. S-D1]|uniref:PAS domain S-box protein n=1 Tax=Jeotgalibacillus sp. S-D1 TaxID=2552189 RepID=UPI00105A462E|nr:PAS domain S-box protein [Jeotgalibacillus sp. S-D1]TDL35250.1 PAS domain S-box protein [Jeotgalibacillus sp. S-D1]